MKKKTNLGIKTTELRQYLHMEKDKGKNNYVTSKFSYLKKKETLDLL